MTEAFPASGLLLVHKPSGMTSRRVVDDVVRVIGRRRVGHAGTLDPMADGLLLVLWGKATALAPYLLAYDKTYHAAIRFGIVTDTQDRTGLVLREGDVSRLTQPVLEQTMRGFVGVIAQTPPHFSAVKHGGERLYRMARRGERPLLASRSRTVRRFALMGWEPPVARCEVVCSSGTYVRTLAHDLGEALGPGACLEALTRTAVGPFSIRDAVHGSHLRGAQPADLATRARSAAEGLPDWPALVLTESETRRVGQGMLAEVAGRLGDLDKLRLLDAEGRLVALARGGESPQLLRVLAEG